jgi:hypothetical protein
MRDDEDNDNDDEDDDAEPDDRELPDPADVDDADDEEESVTEPCPHCGKPVYENADVCPHCRNFLSAADAPPATARRTVTLVVVLCVIVALVWVLLR